MAKNRVLKTAKKATPRKTAAKPKSWNNSEILNLVLGYLTTREAPLILSRNHDAAPVAEVLGKLIEANGLPKPRPNHPSIKIPEGAEGITNMPRVQQPKEQVTNQANLCAQPKKSPDELASHFLNYVLFQTAEDQNKTMASIIKTLSQTRKEQLERLVIERSRFGDMLERAQKNNDELAYILKESF